MGARWLRARSYDDCSGDVWRNFDAAVAISDILAAQADGHISLDPWTPEMVQPASIDVRLDRFFRLFNNHAYTYVDSAENQGELTEQFEVKSDEPWSPASGRVRARLHMGVCEA